MKNLLFSLALFIAGCSSVRTVYIPNYSCELNYYESTIKYYPNEVVMKCKLSENTSIDGKNCISWVWFFDDGQLKQFETANEIKMDNFVIPSHSTIFYNDKSHSKVKYIYLSKNVVINNIECKGGCKISTEFYENGKLKACFLEKDEIIQGYPCKGSIFDPVYFYPDGKIKIFKLSDNLESAATKFKKGETILVEPDGKISKFKR